MNISTCASFCLARSLPLFGLEYSRECYCGASLPSPAPGPLSDDPSDASVGCNMACAGSAAAAGTGTSQETCGGSARISVYNNTLYAAPVHKSTISAMYVPSSAGGSGGTAGTVTYNFMGCYTDTNPRTLQGHAFSAANMSQEVCVNGCAARGWRLAGVEYAEQCFCGSELGTNGGGGGVKVADAECAMLCKGDRSEWCGGRARIGIWGTA